MSFRLPFMIISLLLVSMLLVSSAYANDTPRRAIVNSLEGSVMIQEAGRNTSLPARVGRELKDSDRIITGNNGQAEIVFEDKTVIRISPDTRVTLESLYRNGSDRADTTVHSGCRMRHQ
ncbi:FecR domain-containing protein [Desulfuribacillus alkaliarsenatis]|uniref:FecR protein domain-containing protein n=1 Tax=Desulfuribacillus alkaliarsenatis TaxID=766136 RepID=A0A1E5G2V5_9FIRM|nr:FecR domain-containing protein [Desulfuribacillus alkaliarsenatis]OEF96861.1 hypothetical protein BHF68_07315 [Desulfuribacillus alkaliarsenatis]